MPTLTEYLQTPEAFTLQSVIAEHPSFLDAFITYLTNLPDPLLCNEREAYLYPSKVAQILAVGMSYRLMVEKQHISEDKVSYPFLQKFFNEIKNQPGDPTLLGYCSKVLIALVRKTPQIYEFIKDNQQLLIDILKEDDKMDYLREFLALFLTQSTMELYLFIKNMLVRTLVFRIVEEEQVGVSLYRCITFFYEKAIKALDEASEDQKPQLRELCKLFEEQHFLTLLILKLDSFYQSRNNYITELLSLACLRSKGAREIIALHVDTILDYLEEYEESESFMEQIKKEHLAILSLLVELVKTEQLGAEAITQFIKRLLVYSNVHQNNSLLHNLLYKSIVSTQQQGRVDLFNDLNIIPFFLKNTTDQRYGFMSLRRRVFRFWIQHKLDEEMSAEERQAMRSSYNTKEAEVNKSKYYKQWAVGGMSKDLGNTKAQIQLSAMTSVVSSEEEKKEEYKQQSAK